MGLGLVFFFFILFYFILFFGMRSGCRISFFGFFNGVVKMEEEKRQWGGEGRLGMEGLGEGWVGLRGGGVGRTSASRERDKGGRSHPRERRERRERERVVEEG